MARCRDATSAISRPGRYWASTISNSPLASRGTRLSARRTKVGVGRDVDIVQARLVRRPVFRRQHGNPCGSRPGASGSLPRRLAGFGLGQGVGPDPDRAAEKIDRHGGRHNADRLDELRIADAALPGAIEPGAGQAAGVGGDPMDHLHEVPGQIGRRPVTSLDGVWGQRGLAFPAIGADPRRPRLGGDREAALRSKPRARRRKALPGACVSGRQILADDDVRGCVGERAHTGDPRRFAAQLTLHPLCNGAISALLSPP